MVACEAMAAGKPVVASRAGGLPEIVAHNVTGLLVPPGDENALAGALAALLLDPDRMRQMGERARARSAMFSWANAASSLDDIYARLEPDSGYHAAVERPRA
jgi:glycosyltransferase involved in cell wall biosynthesis